MGPAARFRPSGSKRAMGLIGFDGSPDRAQSSRGRTGPRKSPVQPKTTANIFTKAKEAIASAFAAPSFAPVVA
jgi:hypothetical protein